MKLLSFMLLLMLISACASEKSNFVKEQVCSNQAIKYLKNPRNKIKHINSHPLLKEEMANTSKAMQSCYESFGHGNSDDEFNTCLVVGVNEFSQVEFYDFSSQQINLDPEFIQCTLEITKTIQFEKYGPNTIFIHAYKFYVEI